MLGTGKLTNLGLVKSWILEDLLSLLAQHHCQLHSKCIHIPKDKKELLFTAKETIIGSTLVTMQRSTDGGSPVSMAASTTQLLT